LLGRIRAKYQALMRPVGKGLGKSGITPNALTTISLVVAIGAGTAYALKFPVLGAVGLVVSGVVDMLDGAVARATKSASRFGTVYDHVLDRYVEFFVLAGIGLGGFSDWIWVLFCLFGMVMASFTRAKAESVGGLKQCTVGIAERQEKLIILLIGSFLQPFVTGALMVAVIVVGVLSHITVVQRLHYTFKETRKA
jgi:CDP-diacylglycerol--glycerol-3-phosphate 3-phosphatidyltransferase/archaetidylinositol phosphate synthase